MYFILLIFSPTFRLKTSSKALKVPIVSIYVISSQKYEEHHCDTKKYFISIDPFFKFEVVTSIKCENVERKIICAKGNSKQGLKLVFYVNQMRSLIESQF